VKIQFRLAGFLATRFSLVSNQPIGFQANGPWIRTCRLYKPLLNCFRENAIFISWFLSGSIPIGFQLTNRISGEWTPDSNSSSSKIYGDLSSVWSRNAVKYFSYTAECCNLIGGIHSPAFWGRRIDFFSVKSTSWLSSGRNSVPCKVWLHLLVRCRNA
jgi:hypothetical protein